MLHGVFITGTDTNVGKTVVAAALMRRYRGRFALRYWKPIQTGVEQDDDRATVRLLADCNERELSAAGIRLRRPLSPHLAAELSGIRISVAELEKSVAGEANVEGWVVEGAGGALVPVNESELMTDLMQRLSLPILIVARASLGTINHTLLTLEALRSRALPIAGVVMVGERNRDNRNAIERFGAVEVIAEMPYFQALSAATLERWAGTEFDTPGRLSGYFQ